MILFYVRLVIILASVWIGAWIISHTISPFWMAALVTDVIVTGAILMRLDDGA